MDELVQMGHGGGGGLGRRLIEQEIVARFGVEALQGLPDAATLRPATASILFTTDSHVVQPLEFPGGSIGDLAVHGTVNDLAVSGGTPRWLSLGLILAEGLPLATLRRVLDAVRDAALACEVRIVTGDTKVVARGECDGIYINTAGIAEALPGFRLSAGAIQAGDAVLVSGPLGDHGMAVMAARGGIHIGGLVSDTGPVHRLVAAAHAVAAAEVRFMRDPTRGGLAAVANELVGGRAWGIRLDEVAIPVSAPTRAVAEMLGMDLLGVACEGRVVMVCAETAADAVLDAWRSLPEGAGAARIGRIVADHPGRVVLHTLAGGTRLVDVPMGELLPRIC